MSDANLTHNEPLNSRINAAKQALAAQQFSIALTQAEQALALDANAHEALYIQAVSLRYLKRYDEALTVLDTLIALKPQYARAYQERGHCYRDQNIPAKALPAYAQAVELNPTLAASWRALVALYPLALPTAPAEPDKASQRAKTVLAHLETLPPAVVTAQSWYFEGDLQQAENLIRAFLLQNPEHIEAMRLLATIGLRLEVFDDAETLLAAILERAPDHHAARYDYVQALLGRHKHAIALGEVERLLADDPRHEGYLSAKGNALVGLGRQAEALEVFYRLRDIAPQNPTVHLAIAHAEKTVGHTEAAIAAYRQAARVREEFGDAYWSLANLKTYRFTDAEIQSMQALVAREHLATDDRIHLYFALGKACEDRQAYQQAFEYYSHGNQLKHATIEFDVAQFERTVARQIQLCDQDFFAKRSHYGAASAEPIFIVGLPRAGSTLLEQILASHPEVEGIRELAEIPRLVTQLHGREVKGQHPRYPDILTELSAQQCEAFGNQYLKDTRLYRSRAVYFIDKMPNNFRHIGLIQLILPNAKIIDARREPMACCFSNFKQLFASGQEFTYSLDDIGRYYRAYIALMHHWQQVLPQRVLTVQHESVVDDLETNVRQLLDFCGLPFHAGCLKFYATERSVRTPSSEQVRRPIFRDGLDRWQAFEPWLDPLKAALAGNTAAKATDVSR